MAEYTQTIRRQHPTNCLSVSVHFVGLTLKGLKLAKMTNQKTQKIFKLRQ